MAVMFMLDTWDQQLIAAAKSEGDRAAAVRRVWAERVGIDPKSVSLGPVIRRLAEIVEGCRVASLLDLLEAAERLHLSRGPGLGRLVETLARGDFDSAKDQAIKALERVQLIGRSEGVPAPSDFTELWFVTLMNAIQCAPRSKFAAPCTADD
jgi:hypothetical protein